MEKPTKRQDAVLRVIRRAIEREGVPPTLRETAQAMKLDPKSVAQHIDRLERKGYIRRRPGQSRNVRLTEKGRAPKDAAALQGVPLVGQIAAGVPVLAEENLEGRVKIEELFGPEESFFFLRVKGDSMEGAGIRDGDLAAVRTGKDLAGKGEIAVVVVNNEATVKRFYRRGSLIRLEPENPAFDTMEADAEKDDIRVAGAVGGLIRKM